MTRTRPTPRPDARGRSTSPERAPQEPPTARRARPDRSPRASGTADGTSRVKAAERTRSRSGEPPSRRGRSGPDARIAARRSAVAHDVRRRRLGIVGIVALVVALGASGFAALHSPLLSARHLTVRGGPHETRATVLAVTGLSHHPPLIDIDTARDATAIDALPYVLRASVVRNWPEGVTVTIVERTPVGWVARKAGGFAIVDRSGRVLGFTVATPTAGGLTALTDVGPVPGAGRFLGASGAAVAALAAAVPDGLRGYVRSVGALSSEDLDLRLNSGATALFGGVTALSAKFVALATLIASAPTAVRAARLIDLRDPTSPVLTP